MSTAAPAIAVVVVTYNSADVLGACLDSLAAGCRGVRLVEVAVADNASADGTVAIARSRTDLPVRVVELGRNAGYAAGVHAGVHAVADRGVDAVLVLNPDITVHPGAVAVLARALEPPRRGIAVPRLVNPDGSLQPSLRRRPTLTRALVESLIGGTTAGRIGQLSAALRAATGRRTAKAAMVALVRPSRRLRALPD